MQGVNDRGGVNVWEDSPRRRLYKRIFTVALNVCARDLHSQCARHVTYKKPRIDKACVRALPSRCGCKRDDGGRRNTMMVGEATRGKVTRRHRSDH